MKQIRVVAWVTTRMEHTNSYLLSWLCSEDRSHRIATNLIVCEHLREIQISSLFKRRVRREAHAFPERLGAIVDSLLSGVFRIFRLCKIRHGDTVFARRFAEHTVEAKIDIVLEHRHKLAEDRAVRPRDIDLRTRSKIIVPQRSLRFDD